MKTLRYFLVVMVMLLGLVSSASAGEKASNPSPADGAVCVDPNVVLSWSPGSYANKHDVYFGINFNDVYNATPFSPAGVYEGRQDPNSYNPGGLPSQHCPTYYWRIDEVNGPNIWKGDVWSFTTKGDDCCHCIVPPEGMVAWWPFDEEPGTTIANDIAGSINDQGTLINGASFTSGMVEGGLLLDGVNDYVEVPDSPELNFGEGNLSVDMWVNLVPNQSDIRTIIDKRTIGSTVQGYTVYILEGKLAFQLADAGVASTTCGPDSSCVNYLSGVTIANGEWNHIAVTVDRGQTNGGIWYVNGIEVGNRFNPTFINGSLTNSSPLWIGRHANWGSSYIHGILDEIELFNRVLDANEIWAIFKAGSDGKCKCKPAPAYSGDIKWSQPPERNYLGCINGWDEVSIYYNEPIIADDWRCRDNKPIKDIHWWGSFKGWTEPNQSPPYDMPRAFHIGIWTDVPAGIKRSQLPDPCGLDVAFFSEYLGIEMCLADDWLCTQTGPVRGIHFWGSRKNDGGGIIGQVLVRIYSDDPCGPDGHSQPNDLLWSRTFNAGKFSYHLDGTGDQEWLDPLLDPNGGWPNHHLYFRIDINDINDPFIQQAGTIYWLSVRPSLQPGGGDRLGWKTSRDHWNDDAVYAYGGYHELRDPNTGESLDLAFEIITNGDANAEYSHPGRLIWEKRCESFVWSYAGCDVDPRNTIGIDACFQFDQLLSQDQWFHQETNEPNGTVYWLSIAAIYDGNVPLHPWGWKTRPHFYNDDAVRITSLGSQWPPVIGSVWAGGEPIEYPAGTSWDVAFVLTTNREYQPMKWWWPNEETRAADIYPDGIINLKDMAVLAGNWLTEGEIWPDFDMP